MADPLESAEVAARRMAKAIGAQMPEGWGFILWLMSYGPDGHATYLSSLRRDDAIRALEEWIAHQKALPDTAGFADHTALECWCCGAKETLATFRGPLRSVHVCATCIMGPPRVRHDEVTP